MEAGKSQDCSRQAGDTGEPMFQYESKGREKKAKNKKPMS